MILVARVLKGSSSLNKSFRVKNDTIFIQIGSDVMYLKFTYLVFRLRYSGMEKKIKLKVNSFTSQQLKQSSNLPVNFVIIFMRSECYVYTNYSNSIIFLKDKKFILTCILRLKC